MELKDEADAHKQYVLSNFLLLVFWCNHASAGLCSEAPEHQQVGGCLLPSEVAPPSHLFGKDWPGRSFCSVGVRLVDMLLFSGFSQVEMTKNHSFYFYSPLCIFHTYFLKF